MSNRGNALGLYDTPPSLCLEGTTPEDRSLIRHYVSFSCSALREKGSVFVPSRSLAFIFFPFAIYLIKVPVFLPF